MVNLELSPSYQERKSNQEECGITGNYSKIGKMVSPETPIMQQEIHNRGRDTFGMAVFVDGKINVLKGSGLPSQVIRENFNFEEKGLLGTVAIGHNRYATTGGEHKDDLDGAQPMVAEWKGRNVAIAYNGNLPESERQKLKSRLPSSIPESRFDTEDIANAIATANGNTWEEKIIDALGNIQLAYSLTILSDQGELFGLRSPSGTWPLWIGENEDRIILASETIVDSDPTLRWSQVNPGELVKATPQGVERKKVFESEIIARCSLHDVYGARRDGLMTEKGLTYSDFSVRLGEILAEEHPIVDADLYIGLPKSGIPIAEGYARRLGKKPSNVINADGHRSYIAPDNLSTLNIIKDKYSIPQSESVVGKKVVVLDDSAIKGATLGGDPKRGIKGVAGILKEAGASRIDVGLVLPKFVNGCDMGYVVVKDSLVAVAKNPDGAYRILSDEEIANRLGVNSIFFVTKDGLSKAYEEFFGQKDITCMACVGGEHPLKKIAQKQALMGRSDLVFSA